MNPRKLIAITTAILMASTSAFAAVKNGASLKGNEYTKGGNNAKGGGVIAWNSYSSLVPDKGEGGLVVRVQVLPRGCFGEGIAKKAVIAHFFYED